MTHSICFYLAQYFVFCLLLPYLLYSPDTTPTRSGGFFIAYVLPARRSALRAFLRPHHGED
jgi:hypothetical protein